MSHFFLNKLVNFPLIWLICALTAFSWGGGEEMSGAAGERAAAGAGAAGALRSSSESVTGAESAAPSCRNVSGASINPVTTPVRLCDVAFALSSSAR